jgi:hypothetical protein
LQEAQRGRHSTLHEPTRGSSPVLLGDHPLYELARSCDQLADFGEWLIGEGPDRWWYRFRARGQDLGIDRIGFGQLADGSRKAAHRPRIDHRYRQTRLHQCISSRVLMATRGFENKQLGRYLSPTPSELFDPGFVIDKTQPFTARPHGPIESSLADIHPDPGDIHHHFRSLVILP